MHDEDELTDTQRAFQGWVKVLGRAVVDLAVWGMLIASVWRYGIQPLLDGSR